VIELQTFSLGALPVSASVPSSDTRFGPRHPPNHLLHYHDQASTLTQELDILSDSKTMDPSKKARGGNYLSFGSCCSNENGSIRCN
jgi:hypothetical protein